VIKTCQYCGAVNGDASNICCFCDAPLGDRGRTAVSRRVTTPIEGNLAVQPEWRRELSSKLRDYRARRGGALSERQTALPFESDSDSSIGTSDSIEEYSLAHVSPPPPASGRQRSERFEISISRPETSPALAHAHGPAYSLPGIDLPPAPFFPVASLLERRRAALLDGALLLFSYGGMLALFTVLGGHIGLDKLDLFVAGATFALFYAQYFALFTIFGGSTPGMMLRRLRVVSFDGSMPTSRQMAWRSFGYLISAGTCMLGFLWAVWDEDHLCWQDRISQTYLTPADESSRD
jgi:uncharacterized RDD family membrane protein YckC